MDNGGQILHGVSQSSRNFFKIEDVNCSPSSIRILISIPIEMKSLRNFDVMVFDVDPNEITSGQPEYLSTFSK